MKIKPFLVEEWMNKYETGAKYNIAETCVDSVSLNQLFEICGEDKDKFLSDFSTRRLTYGDIEGNPAFLEGVCSLFRTVKPEHIITCHGASGANHHIFYSLIEPGDEIISIMPTYQQLYSIPESFGADVKIINLEKDNNYLPDLEHLKNTVSEKTKLICINNPNNPTGALISNETLREICRIAAGADAWVLCDEVYRHLTQNDEYCESVVDIYEKGISTGSMSKVFSLAGLRLGWIVTKSPELRISCLSHRDYNLISGSLFDEEVAAIALKNKDKILARNKDIVRKNLEIVDRWAAGEEKISYVKPAAGTTALIYYNFDIPSYQFCETMYHTTGTFVTPGVCFEQEHCFRLGYAADTETLIKGLEAISRFIRQLENQ